MIGLSMALTGACPGTVPVQLSTGIRYIMAGGILGGILYPRFSSCLRRNEDQQLHACFSCRLYSSYRRVTAEGNKCIMRQYHCETIGHPSPIEDITRIYGPYEAIVHLPYDFKNRNTHCRDS